MAIASGLSDVSSPKPSSIHPAPILSSSSILSAGSTSGRLSAVADEKLIKELIAGSSRAASPLILSSGSSKSPAASSRLSSVVPPALASHPNHSVPPLGPCVSSASDGAWMMLIMDPNAFRLSGIIDITPGSASSIPVSSGTRTC